MAHLTADFKYIYEDFNYLTIVETSGILKAPLPTVSRQLASRDPADFCVYLVVDIDSAQLGLPRHQEHIIDLDRDHRQICKLTNDSVFERIVRHIKWLVAEAKRRATDEGRENQVQTAKEQ